MPSHWATGAKDQSITQPRVSLITFSPPWNGGIFGAYRLTGLRMRSYVPTHTSIKIPGTQGDMFITRRTRKNFVENISSKWDPNSCPRRCKKWWCYLLSYRGRRSIDYTAQGNPYTNMHLNVVPVVSSTKAAHCNVYSAYRVVCGLHIKPFFLPVGIQCTPR